MHFEAGEYQDVQTVLTNAIAGYTAKNGGIPPDLMVHQENATDVFGWETRAEFMQSVAFGRPLIQPEVIGNHQGARANIVIDLTIGILADGFPRMPKGGPFLPNPDIQIIIDWIHAGCPV